MKRLGFVYYGWIVVAACFVGLMSTSGAQNAFGLLFKPMLLEMEWDRSSLSLGMSVNMIFYGLSQPLMGQLADRFGPRWVIGISSVIIAVGLALLGTATEIWQMYIYYGVIAAFGLGGVAPVTIAALISRWFIRRRGLALSIATTGLAAGQIVIIPLSMYFVLVFGWRPTTFWLAALVLLIMLPMSAFVMKGNPGEVGALPDGVRGPDPETESGTPGKSSALERRFPAALALRQRSFWQLCTGFFFCGFSWSLILTHLIPFALDTGISEMLTANALSFMSLVSLVCSIVIGGLSDRYGRNQLLGLVYLLRALSFLMLPWVNSVPLLFAFSFIHGTGRLASVPLTSALTGDQFGRASVGTILGMILVIHQIGAALGAYVGGYFYDTTGSYFGAFGLAAVIGLVAALASFSIDQKQRPVDNLAILPARA